MKQLWRSCLLVASVLSLSAVLAAPPKPLGDASSDDAAHEGRPRLSTLSEQEYDNALALRSEDHKPER